MRIFVDTADLKEIEKWAAHPWVSGFTTNPTLMRQAHSPQAVENAPAWARRAVEASAGKPISIDGPSSVWDIGPNVWRKVSKWPRNFKVGRVNHTAVVCVNQIQGDYNAEDIISVFAGRIMDSGRYPSKVIAAAQETGALVLWASCREPYNIVQAEQAGCDIITVPPAILKKFLDWNGKPLEVIARETITQFEADSEGLWS